MIDETFLTGDINGTCTTSIANSISSDGTSQITNEVSYSYNPKGQNIVNSLGNQYVKTWNCTPASHIENGSWKIEPAITVQGHSGLATSTTVKCYVSEIQLSGGVRNYTGGEVSVNLTFTNHS